MHIDVGKGSYLRWILLEGEEMSVFTGCPHFFLCQLQAEVKEMMRSFVDRSLTLAEADPHAGHWA